MKRLLARRLSSLPNISCSPNVRGLTAGEIVVFKRAVSMYVTCLRIKYGAIPIILNVEALA